MKKNDAKWDGELIHSSFSLFLVELCPVLGRMLIKIAWKCSIKGITLKIHILCLVLINSIILNLLCVWIFQGAYVIMSLCISLHGGQCVYLHWESVKTSLSTWWWVCNCRACVCLELGVYNFCVMTVYTLWGRVLIRTFVTCVWRLTNNQDRDNCVSCCQMSEVP